MLKLVDLITRTVLHSNSGLHCTPFFTLPMNKDVHASFETITLKKSQCKLITMNKKIINHLVFNCCKPASTRKYFVARYENKSPNQSVTQ